MAGRSVKTGGLMEVDYWLVRMEWRPPGLSVCLPLVILPSTIKSTRSFLPAPAHPDGPGKRAVKWWWWCGFVGNKSQIFKSTSEKVTPPTSRTPQSRAQMYRMKILPVHGSSRNCDQISFQTPQATHMMTAYIIWGLISSSSSSLS